MPPQITDADGRIEFEKGDRVDLAFTFTETSLPPTGEATWPGTVIETGTRAGHPCVTIQPDDGVSVADPTVYVHGDEDGTVSIHRTRGVEYGTLDALTAR